MSPIRMAHEAAAIYRSLGMPVKAIGALGNEFGGLATRGAAARATASPWLARCGPSWNRCPIAGTCSRLAPMSPSS